jgi:Family of unknown function (DUF5565)
LKKIPTMFERDWAGDKSRVIDKIHPGCEWVTAGEGIATRKIDGTSCLVRDGFLYKRREVKDGDLDPEDFELSTHDEDTGKRIGWVPVSVLGPEDKWHRAAFAGAGILPNGTYELVGPKVQGNPEGFTEHVLISHDSTGLHPDAPRTFDGLREWLSGMDIEGIVFHHPDGRMAKVKKKDFGLKRK